jgi:hypothetical protein
VLVLVRQGLANKQIARRLGISERTVKAHLTSVFQRIGVVDRTQAALWAERNGLDLPCLGGVTGLADVLDGEGAGVAGLATTGPVRVVRLSGCSSGRPGGRLV